MKKKEIVKDKILFNKIIQQGKKKSNKFFIIYYLQKPIATPKFGFAVGKKIGNAVERNKIKRRLRNIITANKNLFSLNYDYIIIAKKFCKYQKYDTLELSMKNLIRKEVE